ncbi:MAG TPA: tetratricopeptide repeat protein, partial [Chthonomonadales bacterium]|nr:tetratricopeptide repeat protein [Chthonomonadales bacterium]
KDCLPHLAGLKALGDHRLRDLGRPETVFQLIHPELPGDFPPIRSLGSADLPNNLPIQSTSFIGRETELTKTRALLTRTRLMTLTGSGGCGKTRLALQLAADIVDNYTDGVWLVELAGVTDSALVPQAVASVLTPSASLAPPILDSLCASLKSKRLLLLMDNCEHILEACAALADSLLRTCAGITVLATSREGLSIPGEVNYSVPSLSLPEPVRSPSTESIYQSEAVRLFAERAALHQPEFHITPQNGAILAAICRRLDGIPLAIELAAARARSLSLVELNARLDQRFRLLTGGSRTALPRQQTLRAAIDWSYRLLSPAEKSMLQRLSGFVGGWSLPAAEHVCANDEEEALPAVQPEAGSEGMVIKSSMVLELLTTLTDKSLVSVDTSTGATRYRLLETVRQFARELFDHGDDGPRVRDRHRDYFLALAETAAPNVMGAAQGEWIARLEEDHENLIAAVSWCQAGESGAEKGVRMVGALWRFWMVRGHLTTGRLLMAEALARPEAAAPTLVRAKALVGAGGLAWSQGDLPEAHRLNMECLSIFRQLGDKRAIAGTLGNLGMIAAEQGDGTSARKIYEECLAIQRELGLEQDIAGTLCNMGNIADREGDVATARRLYEESLEIDRRLGSPSDVADTIDNLAGVAMDQGDPAAAMALLQESLPLRRSSLDKSGLCRTLNDLALTFFDLGDYPAARKVVEESLATRRESADPRGIAACLSIFARLAMVDNELEQAARLWGAIETHDPNFTT